MDEHNAEIDEELKKYKRRQWWEENKQKVIAYIIMSCMIVGWLLYVIIMTSKGYVLMFN